MGFKEGLGHLKDLAKERMRKAKEEREESAKWRRQLQMKARDERRSAYEKAYISEQRKQAEQRARGGSGGGMKNNAFLKGLASLGDMYANNTQNQPKRKQIIRTKPITKKKDMDFMNLL